MPQYIENIHGRIDADIHEIEFDSIDEFQSIERIEEIRDRFNVCLVELTRWMVQPRRKAGRLRRLHILAKVLLPEFREMTYAMFGKKLGATKQNTSAAMREFSVRFGWIDNTQHSSMKTRKLRESLRGKWKKHGK